MSRTASAEIVWAEPQISSDLLSVIKVSLCEHIWLHGCGDVQSSILLFSTYHFALHKGAWGLHVLLGKKGALWQRPDVPAKWNMLALTQYLFKSCFWALDFLVQDVVMQHKLLPQPGDNKVVCPAIDYRLETIWSKHTFTAVCPGIGDIPLDAFEVLWYFHAIW